MMLGMKRVYVVFLCGLSVFSAFAQNKIDVLELRLQGKLVETVNPFDRFNADDYPEVYDDDESLIRQIQSSAGYFVAFRSNTQTIQIEIFYRNPEHHEGCDLYIKKDGKWLYAGSQPCCRHGSLISLVRYMDGSDHECIVYFPRQTPIAAMNILIDNDAYIEALECPFRHRIAVLGSSFTQGAGVTRPGCTWSSQLSRMTGLMFINMGFCGNCKLQTFYAQILGRSDAEAYVIDAFSNPSSDMIRERLNGFIEELRRAEKESGKSPKPVIFLKTIWREGNNFNVKKLEREMNKMQAADEMMRMAVKKYEDVYWVTSTSATDTRYHETCTDGTHPNDYGYTLWAESVHKPILRILSRYGIK